MGKFKNYFIHIADYRKNIFYKYFNKKRTLKYVKKWWMEMKFAADVFSVCFMLNYWEVRYKKNKETEKEEKKQGITWTDTQRKLCQNIKFTDLHY